MREVKFRGKNKNGYWEYGAYHKHFTRTLGAFEDSYKDDEVKYIIISDKFSDWNMPRGIQVIEVDPATIGQCTGLVDKNNKEIYEGDELFCISEGYRGDVKFENGCFVTDCQGWGYKPLCECNFDDIEIV